MFVWLQVEKTQDEHSVPRVLPIRSFLTIKPACSTSLEISSFSISFPCRVVWPPMISQYEPKNDQVICQGILPPYAREAYHDPIEVYSLTLLFCVLDTIYPNSWMHSSHLASIIDSKLMEWWNALAWTFFLTVALPRRWIQIPPFNRNCCSLCRLWSGRVWWEKRPIILSHYSLRMFLGSICSSHLFCRSQLACIE